MESLLSLIFKICCAFLREGTLLQPRGLEGFAHLGRGRFFVATREASAPSWRNGRRTRLKSAWPRGGRASLSLALGIRHYTTPRWYTSSSLSLTVAKRNNSVSEGLAAKRTKPRINLCS